MDKHLTFPQNIRAGSVAFITGVLLAMPTLLGFSLLSPDARAGELAFVAATPLFIFYLFAQIAAKILPQPKNSKPSEKPTKWQYAVGITGLTGIASLAMGIATLVSIPLYWRSNIASPVSTAIILAT